MSILHHGELITASLNESIVRPIPDTPAASQTPTQPRGREPVRRRRPREANDNNPRKR